MWWATYGDSLVFAVAVLLYGGLLARFLPDKHHLLVNTVASVAAILYGLWRGLTFADLGLSIHFIIPGLAVTILASLAIMLIAGLVTVVSPLFRAVTSPTVARPGNIAYHTAVRIPLSTALSEEILFRGVLLGLLLAHSSTFMAIVLSAIIFGVWHALPSLRDHHKLAALPIVGATAVAGVAFGWLRIVAGSIIAPWLLHWTINSSALLAVHFIQKQKHDN